MGGERSPTFISLVRGWGLVVNVKKVLENKMFFYKKHFLTIMILSGLLMVTVNFQNEAMTGSHTQNRVFSRITLALMEDTG